MSPGSLVTARMYHVITIRHIVEQEFRQHKVNFHTDYVTRVVDVNAKSPVNDFLVTNERREGRRRERVGERKYRVRQPDIT